MTQVINTEKLERYQSYVEHVFRVYNTPDEEPVCAIVTGFFFQFQVYFDDGETLYYEPDQFEKLFCKNGKLVGVTQSDSATR